ncbi:error-prone DNA polymerase [Celerinatantimonas yamalensis]|uniref:Error-prone DNA polymerase n=1 Tax=Celerinatantimonas yamalensis TaxID=559956 RepID=A0ABW9G4X7_9GAMM
MTRYQRRLVGGYMAGLLKLISGFAELNALSWFSFLKSAASPEQLVEGAAHRGYEAIAITDECSLAGVVRAWQQSKITPIQLIIGASFLTYEQLQLVVLVKNTQGYQQLCRAISQARQAQKGKTYQISAEQLTACDQCLILWRPTALSTLSAQLSVLSKAHWSEQYALITDDLSDSAFELSTLRQQLQQRQIQPVASTWPRLISRRQKGQIDLIDAIAAHTPLAQMGQRLAVNAERRLQPRDTLSQRYRPSELQASCEIAQQCHFALDSLRYHYPNDHAPSGMTADQYLQRLTEQGIDERFPEGMKSIHQQQLDKELKLISQLNYANYFLTIYDLVQFAKHRHILYQGRGSAANSIVCYLLGITEVDPDQVNLLFERFISKERLEPPDIDVDFEHHRREEVIQYIYQKYGRDRAALTATVICYRARSALRDVGKALELSDIVIEQLGRLPDWRDKSVPTQTHLQRTGLLSPTRCQQLANMVDALRGMPRHLSQHVGGFVIARDKLVDLVPIEPASMANRTIIQWDKNDLEALGMMKVDVLALGMLSAIRRALDLIRHLPNSPQCLADIPKEDPNVYAMITDADTIGVFQIESRAQMNMLPRLKPSCYYDLVIEVAIVRPGPIQGEMVHPYLLRREGKQPYAYPNQAIEKVLSRTLGIPIFQEQVIQLAMVAANFNAGEADQLRRAITGWKHHTDLAPFEQKLREGLAKNGYDTTFSQQVIQQIHGFGGYGFPESHAASFALLVYFSAWLKYYYPAQFCASLLNSQPMGFYSSDQLIQDARRHQVNVLAIDICHSHWQHTIEDGALRLGLCLVSSLSFPACQRFLHYRDEHTITADTLPLFFDLSSRQALAKADALRFLLGHRYQAQWEISQLYPTLPLLQSLPKDGTIHLPAPSEYQDVLSDYYSTKVSLRRHPLTLLREQGALRLIINSQQLQFCHHGQLVCICGLVTGRQRPGSPADVTFVTLEDEYGAINVIVWSATAKAQRKALIEAQLLTVYGIVEREERVIHVVAGRLIDDSDKLAMLPVFSRDFR